MKSIESRLLWVIELLEIAELGAQKDVGDKGRVVSKHYGRGLKRAIEIIHITFPDVFVTKEATDNGD